MIEVLIKYITDRGYRVRVMPATDSIPGVLCIRRRVGDQICGVDWCILNQDLHPDMEDYLYHIADLYMGMIEQAIQERSVPA